MSRNQRSVSRPRRRSGPRPSRPRPPRARRPGRPPPARAAGSSREEAAWWRRSARGRAAGCRPGASSSVASAGAARVVSERPGSGLHGISWVATGDSTATGSPPSTSDVSAASIIRTTSSASSSCSSRGRSGAHGVDEVLELDRERLAAVEVRRDDVAGAVGEVVLAERLGIAVDDAAVEDAHRLGRAVLVDDHLLAADEHRAAQLARRQPAHLDVGERPGAEAEAEEGDVGDPLDDGVAPAGGDRLGPLVEPVAQDREVVGAEVPDHADVALVQAEVHPARGDEVEVAELARVEQLLDRAHRRAVDERVAAHQHEAGLARDPRQLLGLDGRGRERLLDERVLARPQARRGERRRGCRPGVAIRTASSSGPRAGRRTRSSPRRAG